MTPIHFYASRQLLMKVPDFFTYEGSLQRLNKDFTAYNEPLYIRPSLKSKELPNGTTRFQLRLARQAIFDEITTLDIKTEHRFDTNNAYIEVSSILPNEIKEQPDKGHYLFIDIATQALVSGRERSQKEHDFVDMADAHKFFVRTESLRSIRDMYPAITVPKVSAEIVPIENISSNDDELPKAG